MRTFTRCFGLLTVLLLLAPLAALAQVCTAEVCVVNYEAPDQRTTFELRNLRAEAVAVTLWFEFLNGMQGSDGSPLTVVLHPGERREALTLSRLDPLTPGRYRFRFDWRSDPATACASPLACTWWERTTGGLVLKGVRKTATPLRVRMMDAAGDTMMVVLSDTTRKTLVRANADAVRPTLRITFSPDARILLVGMMAPPNLGRAYAERFRGL